MSERFPHWPIVVHRPSLVSRNQSVDEMSKDLLPNLGFVENMRQYSALIGAVPSMPEPTTGDEYGSVSGAFNVVPLTEVTEGVVDAVVRDESHLGGVRFLHHLGDLELPFGNLRDWVANRDHGDVQEMDAMLWARKAAELGMHPTIVALVEDPAAMKGHLVFPRLAK